MENNVISITTTFTTKLQDAKERLTDAIKANDLKAVDVISKEIKSLAATQKRLAQAERLVANAEDEMMGDEAEDTSAEDKALIKAHIRAHILENDDYYYVLAEEKFVLYRPTTNEWLTVSERTLKNHYAPLVVGSEYYNLFMEVLREDGRWFYGRTSSFKDSPDKLNMLRPQLLQPVDDEPHHAVFDLVVQSLCGGKQENIEHFEKVIVAKWHDPSNYLLPVICLSDNGATGKSLFVSKVLTTLFGRSSVFANASMNDFAGQFNGHLAGKLAVLINENCEDSYNHNKMKAIAASPTITFTNKNQMPYEGDNTALLFVTGNSIAGSIRVSGGDVDRRFSLIRGTLKLSTYTSAWMTKLLGEPVNTVQAEEWMKVEGQDILSDPTQCGRWLNHLITKHGRPEHVPALHGTDYQAAVAMQTPLWEQCFEAFFRHPNGFNYVKRNVIYDFYRDEARNQGNRSSLGKKKFYQMVEEWLAKNEPNIQSVTANWDASTATVYIDSTQFTSVSRPSLKSNDGYWFANDGYKIDWQVSI